MHNESKYFSLADAFLFILLALFGFTISLSIGPRLHLYAYFIFIAELVLILLHTLMHPLPFKEVSNKPGILYSLIIWGLAVTAGFSAHAYHNTLADNWQIDYLLLLFHAVFFIYAVDIISNAYIPGLTGKIIRGIKIPSSKNILFILLCSLTFSIALTSGNSSFNNADIVLKHELVFIVACLLLNKPTSRLSYIFNQHRRTGSIILLWALIVTMSYYLSPYELITKDIAISRYYHTIFHLVFFVVIYSFLFEFDNRRQYFLALVPLSVALLSLSLLLFWITSGQTIHYNWLVDPPHADHIRHIGYLATVSTSIAMAFVLHPEQSDRNASIYALLLLTSLTLLFWTGGRAAAISILTVLFILVGYFKHLRRLKPYRLLAILIVFLFSAYLSELLKVFDWNGVIQLIYRSTEASDLNSLTTGRITLWISAIESLEGHWLLGLGPQGYYFMPNWIYGVHPHSLFVQFIVEWGALGATVFLYLLIRAGASVLKSTTHRKTVVTVSFLSAVVAIISLSVHGLVDGTYYHGQPSYYLAIAFAICLSEISVHKRIQRAK